VEAPLESSAEEITRLRRCLNDLVSVMPLPAVWTCGESQRIVSALLDALVGMLRLAFVSVRLNDPEGGRFVEMVRIAEPLESSIGAGEIREALEASLGDVPLKWTPSARISVGNVECSITSTPLGLQGELGVIFIGSQTVDFPRESEALLGLNLHAFKSSRTRHLSRSRRSPRYPGTRGGLRTLRRITGL
jgi:hypothetical protein